MNHAVGADQADQDQHHADHLAGHRGNRHTRHIHVKDNDQQQIQQDVHQTGDHQIIQRTLRVPHRPQDGRAEVIQHIGRHPQEKNPDIQRRPVDHIRRGIHQLKQRPGQQKAQGADAYAHEQRQRNRRMFRPAHGRHIPGAVMPRHRDARPDAEPHEHIYQQVDQGTRGGNRRQRLMARVVPHHDHIRRVIEQLENAGQNQRAGKRQNFRQQRPAEHIDLFPAPFPSQPWKHPFSSV